MTLYVKDSGTWQDATEVHIKKDGSWVQVKEVYVKQNGQWNTTLFEDATLSYTSAGDGTFTVPHGVFRASITVNGAEGGNGGDDGNQTGGVGGVGASISFVINVEPFTTYSYSVGAGGGDGVDRASSAAGGSGGAGLSSTTGGSGGNAGSRGSSGGGGGGGGCSGIIAPDGDIVVIAGGGGGGGGAGINPHSNSYSIKQGKNSTDITIYDSVTSGDNGDSVGSSDGGGGGGGGAGTSGNPNFVKQFTIIGPKSSGWWSSHCYRKYYNTPFRTISKIVPVKSWGTAGSFGSSYGISGKQIWVDRCWKGTVNVYGELETGSGGSINSNYDAFGYGGQGGSSYINSELAPNYTTETLTRSSGTADDGSITVTWLPDKNT